MYTSWSLFTLFIFGVFWISHQWQHLYCNLTEVQQYDFSLILMFTFSVILNGFKCSTIWALWGFWIIWWRPNSLVFPHQSFQTASRHEHSNYFFSFSFKHVPQRIVFSFAWNFKCVLRAAAQVKFVPSWSWSYILLLQKRDTCSLRLPAHVNVFPQWWHTKGLSPVWILMCRLRFTFCLNPLPHWTQTKGFSSVWTVMCVLSIVLSVKLFPHRWQE